MTGELVDGARVDAFVMGGVDENGVVRGETQDQATSHTADRPPIAYRGVSVGLKGKGATLLPPEIAEQIERTNEKALTRIRAEIQAELDEENR